MHGARSLSANSQAVQALGLWCKAFWVSLLLHANACTMSVIGNASGPTGRSAGVCTAHGSALAWAAGEQISAPRPDVQPTLPTAPNPSLLLCSPIHYNGPVDDPQVGRCPRSPGKQGANCGRLLLARTSPSYRRVISAPHELNYVICYSQAAAAPVVVRGRRVITFAAVVSP